MRKSDMKNLLKTWNWLEKTLGGVFAFAATMCIFYGVIMRYVFSSSPEWVEEVVIYMIVWAVFIMASTLAEERGHVGATFIVERFPSLLRRVIEIITGMLALGFCVLVSYWGYQVVQVTYLMDERSVTSLRFPLWIAYLSVPTGATLIIFRYVKRIYRLVFRFHMTDLEETHETSGSQELKQ
jgi:C4-dicarboxylate transporter DctQ subunit